MTGLGRKLIHSSVSNVVGQLKDISVDQGKFVPYGIGASQATGERLPEKEIDTGVGGRGGWGGRRTEAGGPWQ